jgi:hypothetical protein
MPKKPKIVWVGSPSVTPITPKERKKLHKLMEKRLDMRRRRYSEVRGKVVDYISHSIDDGLEFFRPRATSETNAALHTTEIPVASASAAEIE